MRANEEQIASLTPGKVMDCLANRIASLRSKLGSIEKHQMGNALTGRKRFMLERMEELERLVTDFGPLVKQRVDARVEILMKPD